MRWKRGTRSKDVIDRRGRSSLGPAGVGAGVGLPAILVLVLVLFLKGGSGDLGSVIGDLTNPQGPAAGAPPSAADEKLADFMSFVLDDVQNFWADSFKQSGKTYERAQLVLFTGSTSSGCGGATSDIGPHYCPADDRVYLDLDFFRELKQRFGAPGDFAQAYVLAHEIGHHVQDLLGIEADVVRQERDHPDQQNDLSVKLELQADCLAGVWAFTAYNEDLLQSGDLQEGLDAAAAVGDDRIQKDAGQRVNPETWTHGSAEQRVRWFTNGYKNGDPNACDTFSADQL
jgi:predicted metalloprotease